MNESTIDMMNLDRRLETLAFQIFAYQRAKEIDHQQRREGRRRLRGRRNHEPQSDVLTRR